MNHKLYLLTPVRGALCSTNSNEVLALSSVSITVVSIIKLKFTLKGNVAIIQSLPTKQKIKSKCVHDSGQFALKIKIVLLI